MIKLIPRSYKLANGIWSPRLIIREDIGNLTKERTIEWSKKSSKFNTKAEADKFALEAHISNL
jgi:hypothetical protein